MSNLLVIFGITGQQGSSLATQILHTPNLSQAYKIRGITRDTTKPLAQAWATKGIEIVSADVSDPVSLRRALKGAHTVFAMTVSIYEPGGNERELAQGKRIADESVAAGAKYIIYSTVPSATKITGGKWPVGSFDCKDAVKEYIEKLPIKSAFFSPGVFMQNFLGDVGPQRGPDGQLEITTFVGPGTEYPLIDITGDTGKFVGAILADPEKYAGKTLCAATGIYTMQDIVEIMSRACGEEIKYNRVSREVYAGFVPEWKRLAALNMLSYFEEFGYYGAESKGLVEWAVENAIEKPVSFEEFLTTQRLEF